MQTTSSSLSYGANERKKSIIFLLVLTLLGVSASCMPQAKPNDEGWDEKFNTAGAKLTLREIERNHLNGRTVVTYSLFVSGLPHDSHYTLWTRLVGRDPQPAADALLDNEGRVASQLADPGRHITEDPINLKVFAGKGEPKEFALISEDGKFRASAKVVPFPMESFEGSCHLSAVMTSENYYGVSIRIVGFQPSEDLLVETRSETEQGQSKAKASDQGTYDSLLLPLVKGKRSGRVRFNVTAKSCRVGVEFPWGEGSYQLQ
jgi:hypothetical protein